MKYFAFAFFVGVVSCLTVFAQNDYEKTEYFVGYSFGLVDDKYDTGSSIGSFFRDGSPHHGFNASAVYNTSKYFGIKGDLSATYNKGRFHKTIKEPGLIYTVDGKDDTSLYNFVGGFQLKDNSSARRVKPFGHAMAGVGNTEATFENKSCGFAYICDESMLTTSISQTGLASLFGGGVDIKINEKLQFRAIQLDYNPIKFNRMKHNGRISVGLVF